MKDMETITFQAVNPRDDEEKRIAELVDILKDSTNVFIKLNYKNPVPIQDLFTTLLAATIFHVYITIEEMIKRLTTNDAKAMIDDAERMFSIYMRQSRDKIR